MTKARNLQRSDTFAMMVPLRVLSVEPLADGLIKVKAETENSPSTEFADGGCVLEIICKSYRDFSASPYRSDNGGGGGDDGGAGIDPLSPAGLEPVG
jgi:hypothetical protein